MAERYLLFVHLCKTGEFEVFDDWCFKRRYEQLNAIKSSRELGGKPQMRDRQFSNEQKAQYEKVSGDGAVAQWRRPDMEAIARGLGTKFVYDAGYDWASSYVHPTSLDGYNDYEVLMGRSPADMSEDAKALLGNACLVSALHIQHFLNEPEYNWRRILYDLLDGFAKTAGGEECNYCEALQKVKFFHESGGGLLVRASA